MTFVLGGLAVSGIFKHEKDVTLKNLLYKNKVLRLKQNELE